MISLLLLGAVSPDPPKRVSADNQSASSVGSCLILDPDYVLALNAEGVVAGLVTLIGAEPISAGSVLIFAVNVDAHWAVLLDAAGPDRVFERTFIDVSHLGLPWLGRGR